MPELVLEIGCEEIPARFVPDALIQLGERAGELFNRERIAYRGLETLGTPRRLVLVVSGMAEKQESKSIEKWGPQASQAFDASGKPTKAALGFAKSLGVDLEKIQTKDSDKGKRLFYQTEQPGKETRGILKSALPELILSLKFPKSMRWGTGKIRFARPIHWILALFSDEVVEFELDGIKAGNQTFGHRFLAPQAMQAKNFESYQASLQKAMVIVDPKERQKMMQEALAKKAQELGAEIYPDPELVSEVNFLIEYPVVLAGEFQKSFLQVPAEVLIASMRGHQRYFALKEKGAELKLKPHFLFVANTQTRDDSVVVKGNEKVLSARLADAEFFYREDLKIPIADRAEQLDQMVFQTGLGSYQDKAQRLEKLLIMMLDDMGIKDREFKAHARRAVKLCKADLLTQMVGEFPELEGIMAGEYARVQKEPEPVWKAAREHYLPKTAYDIEQGRLPQTRLGQLLSIVDKVDSITASFVTGNQPTGSQDPYGIRRMANAIIAIALTFELEFNLDQIAQGSLKLFADLFENKSDKMENAIKQFYQIRLRNIMIEDKIEYDIANAVLGAWDGSMVSAWQRAKALSELQGEPGFEDLFVGFRRVARIIETTGRLDPSLFEYAEEKALWSAFLEVRAGIEHLLKERQWKAAMRELGRLKPFIDKFFDKVMVNVDDPKIRLNRHSLLEAIAGEFRAIADFSQLAGGEKNIEGGQNG